MFRLASLVGLFALTLAATAVLNAAHHPAKKQLPPQDNDTQEDVVLRITAAQRKRTPYFHARFSVN